jgi:hypothetical protein
VWDVLDLGCFLGLGRFETLDVLDLGRFEAWDVLRLGMFCIGDVLDLGHFETETFRLGTLCIWTFCPCFVGVP